MLAFPALGSSVAPLQVKSNQAACKTAAFMAFGNNYFVYERNEKEEILLKYWNLLAFLLFAHSSS